MHLNFLNVYTSYQSYVTVALEMKPSMHEDQISTEPIAVEIHDHFSNVNPLASGITFRTTTTDRAIATEMVILNEVKDKHCSFYGIVTLNIQRPLQQKS